MQIYWSSTHVPELAHLAPSERRAVHRVCYLRYGLWSRQWYLGIVAYCICVAVPTALWWHFHDLLGFALSGWPSIVAIAVGVFVGSVVRMQMLTSHLRPFYANYVKMEFRPDEA